MEARRAKLRLQDTLVSILPTRGVAITWKPLPKMYRFKSHSVILIFHPSKQEIGTLLIIYRVSHRKVIVYKIFGIEILQPQNIYISHFVSLFLLKMTDFFRTFSGVNFGVPRGFQGVLRNSNGFQGIPWVPRTSYIFMKLF